MRLTSNHPGPVRCRYHQPSRDSAVLRPPSEGALKVTDQQGHMDPEGPDAALRADIRRIGKLLGQTLARQEGPLLLDLVEEIRALVRQDAGAAADRLAAMDVTTGTQLARAFSTYFHLANITEQVHRARDLQRHRARDGGWLDQAAKLIAQRGVPADEIAAAARRLA